MQNLSRSPRKFPCTVFCSSPPLQAATVLSFIVGYFAWFGTSRERDHTAQALLRRASSAPHSPRCCSGTSLCFSWLISILLHGYTAGCLFSYCWTFILFPGLNYSFLCLLVNKHFCFTWAELTGGVSGRCVLTS